MINTACLVTPAAARLELANNVLELAESVRREALFDLGGNPDDRSPAPSSAEPPMHGARPIVNTTGQVR